MSCARYPSANEAARYLRELEVALTAARDGASPHDDALAWPEGLDRNILPGLGVRDRTRWALHWTTRLTEGNEALTARELLARAGPPLDHRELRDILLALDECLSECVERGGARPAPATVLAVRVRREVERLTPREATIIEGRVLTRPPVTLAELGRRFAVSSSRVRYIEGRAQGRLDAAFGPELAFVAWALRKEHRAKVHDKDAVHRSIDALLPTDLGSRAGLVTRLIRQAVVDLIDGGIGRNRQSNPGDDRGIADSAHEPTSSGKPRSRTWTRSTSERRNDVPERSPE